MAITYGMSVKEFWEEDPDLFWAYRFSFYENFRATKEYDNFKLWLQGAYFFEAVSIALGNSFGKGHLKYPEKPYIISEDEREKDIERQRKELETKIRNRISEMQKIKGEENSTTKGNEVVKE